LLKAINKLMLGKDEYLDAKRRNIEEVIGEGLTRGLDDIVAQLVDLQYELVRLASNKQKYETVVEEIHRLRALKQNILSGNAELYGKRQCIAERHSPQHRPCLLQDMAKWRTFTLKDGFGYDFRMCLPLT
jgi:site-specific DNA recombinase